MRHPIDVLDAGNYVKAMEVCRRMLAKDPRNGEAQVCMTLANLCLGNYEEALEGFFRANMRAKRKGVGFRDPYIIDIAVTFWLLGRRDEALGRFRACVDGVLDGTSEYADAAGGVSQGLLLWYAGITLRDEEAANHALAYMRGLAKNDCIQNWPGPLAEFAIGTISRDQLLRAAFSTTNELLIWLKTATSRGMKASLIETAFYSGVWARAGGDERACSFWMRECACSRSFPRLWEWHLARAEVKQAESGG